MTTTEACRYHPKIWKYEIRKSKNMKIRNLKIRDPKIRVVFCAVVSWVLVWNLVNLQNGVK